MRLRTALLTTFSSISVLALMQLPASATTVATIDGCYDCNVYDTPTLTFENTSGGTFINAQMVLTVLSTTNNGNTTVNNGVSQTILLPNMTNGTNTAINWQNGNPVATQSPLFVYDYDDSAPGTHACPANPIAAGLCGNPGNFWVTFTATISGGAFDGQSVFSQFSPAVNATGHFVGWEGLNPDGVSEDPLYDVHSGACGPTSTNCTSGGNLATIDLGTPPPLAVPGPIVGAGLPGLMTALGGLLAFWRQRRQKSA